MAHNKLLLGLDERLNWYIDSRTIKRPHIFWMVCTSNEAFCFMNPDWNARGISVSLKIILLCTYQQCIWACGLRRDMIQPWYAQPFDLLQSLLSPGSVIKAWSLGACSYSYVNTNILAKKSWCQTNALLDARYREHSCYMQNCLYWIVGDQEIYTYILIFWKYQLTT